MELLFDNENDHSPELSDDDDELRMDTKIPKPNNDDIAKPITTTHGRVRDVWVNRHIPSKDAYVPLDRKDPSALCEKNVFFIAEPNNLFDNGNDNDDYIYLDAHLISPNFLAKHLNEMPISKTAMKRLGINDFFQKTFGLELVTPIRDFDSKGPNIFRILKTNVSKLFVKAGSDYFYNIKEYFVRHEKKIARGERVSEKDKIDVKKRAKKKRKKKRKDKRRRREKRRKKRKYKHQSKNIFQEDVQNSDDESSTMQMDDEYDKVDLNMDDNTRFPPQKNVSSTPVINTNKRKRGNEVDTLSPPPKIRKSNEFDDVDKARKLIRSMTSMADLVFVNNYILNKAYELGTENSGILNKIME